MDVTAKSNTEQQLESYMAWWKEAGVDTAVASKTQNWLEPPAKTAPSPSKKSGKTPDFAVEPVAGTARENINTFSENPDNWPNDVTTLLQNLKDDSTTPGNHYGGNTVLPAVVAAPKMMLIGDIPDAPDVENGNFLDGPNGVLVGRITNALGIAPNEFIFTALATTRPATGALPESDFPILAKFMMHQIGMFRPEKVVILGSTACQALLGADMIDMRGSLHYFNHNVHKVAAVTIFHPRTLLTRPQMKGQAWKDLQVLKK